MESVGLSLAELRSVQVGRLEECGYEIQEEDVPLPQELSGILVDTQTSAARQCELLKVFNPLNAHYGYYSVVVPLSAERWQWIYGLDEGRSFKTSLPFVIESKMKRSGRRGLTILEGLAVFRTHRDWMKKMPFFLIGSNHYRPESSIVWRGEERGKMEIHRMIPGLISGVIEKVELTVRCADPDPKIQHPGWGFPSVIREY